MRILKINIIIIFLLCAFCKKTIAQCTDQSNYWIESWTSCSASANPNSMRGNSYWMLFEFAEPQAISTTHFWNANKLGESGNGAKTVFIDVSIDGTSWTQVGNNSYSWPQASELDTYEGFDGPDLQAHGFIEKILVTIIDNHNSSNCVSVSELRFDIDPTACYGEIDVCGICNGPGFTEYYEDADNDGLGNPESTIESCVLPTGYVENKNDNCDNGLLGWADVGYIFTENGCTGCHGGPNSESNLDLSSYEGISQGGNICGTNILTGTTLVGIINISNYDGCSSTIPFPSMNERVGNAIDSEEIQLIQTWISDGALDNCNCPPGSPDIDNDGVCDAADLCEGLNDALIGTPCDDGDPCTILEVITANCECLGIPAPDSDFDGVCDELDLASNDPCTADGVIGLPEPSEWKSNESNDCDLDGITLALGDLNDFDDCISNMGLSLTPACACPGEELVGGAKLIESVGITNAHLAVGKPDFVNTGFIGINDYLDLQFPYVEIETEICFAIGFGPEGGIQFEVNDLGFYRFENPDPTLINYEIQTVCFPTFVTGTQNIRISRYLGGGIRVDGSTYDFCPCTESDANKDLSSCKCPGNFTEDAGTYSESFGITNPEEAGGVSDGIFTGNIASTDSLVLTYLPLDENYEICLDILFTKIDGRISFDFDNQNISIVNPAGLGEEGIIQSICFKTNSNTAQTLVIKDIGAGSFKIDGSTNRHCTPCVADTDSDGVCDIDDICPAGDDQQDEDADGIPDACDTCNGNLIGLPCDDSDNCTYNDTFDANCDCVGTPLYHETITGLQGELILQTIDSITLVDDFEVLSNGSFKAGKVITILPGFETKEFMNLEIDIEDCPTGNGN